ncbi:interference hedgehog isoform X1 [Zeugodacus cucurbitae]|uniref:interference hedgehog isoform X1 n=1 Tax=Zeugodacus cucurbitae TaxID=28588 RepID=UPI0005969964|nr:interference hedgehog isoform X1 [Zeugodacus cucurbitae]XP_054088266.1 interference hedgehog isoform X1 [Zeugodacus cucurbitae]XP_054088267.1 interference hedgehog isoform X1 [Zeugodacus cucurbitae]XP_054088269.1 interference hedgehog isoform X1 [Zeugodacus cucurbitae]XP_054088270.1 interference hedgehog isoform X1 [Zeugodacus cucurbitae]
MAKHAVFSTGATTGISVFWQLSFWFTLLICNQSELSAASQSSSLGVYIVRSPESAVAPKGDEVVFECELNMTPDRLEWRFRHTSARATDAMNYSYLQGGEDGHNIVNENLTSRLRVFVSSETLGDYQCVAWVGSAAIASTPARLTLVSISIDNSNGYSRNAIRWSVAPKNCMLIRCGTVTSNPPAVWSFFRNGEKVPQTEVLPSANGALILNSVSSKDSGNYTCSAMNAITGVEVRFPQRIDLRVDYIDRTPPYFLNIPVSQVTARPGETAVLECPGVGSPPPEAVWSSPNVINIYNNRTKVLPYGLQISDVIPEDQGSYVCRLDNGIAPALVQIIKFIVVEAPQILRGPAKARTNEGDELELECSAAGNPFPQIYWLINGEDTSLDNETFHEDRRLVIRHVQKRHAGIVQCFAKNEVGEVSEGSLLEVIPKQIHGEDSAPLGTVPIRMPYEHTGNKNKGKRKHMKMPNMVPPSRPNITRLSDDSVMLRWYVPKNEGLPIQFFKVQYRMLGDSSRKIPRENWQTTNEDIPYGQHERIFEAGKNFTSSVSGLKPDRFYRFRILAVYSNNDNKEGNTSAKFFLQSSETLGPTKATLPAPELLRVEPLSETAVTIHWTLPANPVNVPDGFYAYYRLASSAGEYLKATVDGQHTRKFKIDLLEPGTVYEFKLQSFNALAASEFSAILQGNTKKLATTPAPVTSPTSVKAKNNDKPKYPIVAGIAGCGILLIVAIIAAFLCMKRRSPAPPEDEDKPQLDHIQADFVTPSVLGVAPHHKSGHRLNGVIPRMNITPNPLAQEADKNRNNVMELRFLPNSNSNSSHAGSPNNSASASNLNPNHQHTSSSHSLQQHQQQTTARNTDDVEPYTPPPRSSSSCETLEASEGIFNAIDATSPLSKPLPPLPNQKPQTHHNQQHPQHHQQSHTTLPKMTSNKAQASTAPNANHATAHYNHNTNAMHLHTKSSSSHSSTSSFQSLHNSQAHLGSHQGLHHAQPYHPQAPGTPTLMHKRGDYMPPHHLHHANSTVVGQHPPPVPPHQNNNHSGHHNAHHLYQHHQQQQHAQVQSPQTPSLEQQRRTLERSARNLHYTATAVPANATQPHDAAMNFDGLPTRIPSLRRTRRSSGSANNNNGGVGIPIVPGSPRVQRSPMPARAMMKRGRLGSHNDNMSSGSLNSIEV